MRPVEQDLWGPLLRAGRTAWIGWGALGVLVCLVIGWGTQATLSTAVIARGVLEQTAQSHKVQHITGGQIRTLNVQEGDMVQKGQVLLQFEDVHLRSERRILRMRYAALRAQRHRLSAEAQGETTLLPIQAAADIQRHWLLEKQIFDARRTALADAEHSKHQQIAQIKALITGSKGELAALTAQYRQNQQERGRTQSLVAKGLMQTARVSQLKSEQARLSGLQHVVRARLKAARTDIDRLNTDIAQERRKAQRDAAAELRMIDLDLPILAEQIGALDAQIAAAQLRAPISGIVHDMRHIANRAVVGAAEPVMTLVPDGRAARVALQLSPAQRAAVFLGQSARVVFALSGLSGGQEVHGEVQLISPAPLMDARSGERYFNAHVHIPAVALASVFRNGTPAGVPAQVYLRGHARSALSYLTQPLTRYLRRAFREA